MDNCKETDYKFISTQTEIFNLNCNDIGLYLGLVVIFGILNAIKHYVHVIAAQLHREAMSENPDEKRRQIGKIIGIRTGVVLIHIIDILIISRSNFILIVVAFCSDLIGTSFVYKHHREDHHHPLRSLSKSIQKYNTLKDSDEKKELDEYIKTITTFLQSSRLSVSAEQLELTNHQDIHF